MNFYLGEIFYPLRRFKSEKFEKMEELDLLWKSVRPSALSEEELILFDEIRGKLEECKDKHLETISCSKTRNGNNEKSYKRSDQ